MTRITKFSIGILAGLLPGYALAAVERLVTCTGPSDCNWDALMSMIDRVTKFILFDLALPIAAIMFAYAGIRMITATGEEARNTGKRVFFNTVLGVLYVAGSWLIIRTILEIMGYEGSWIGF